MFGFLKRRRSRKASAKSPVAKKASVAKKPRRKVSKKPKKVSRAKVRRTVSKTKKSLGSNPKTVKNLAKAGAQQAKVLSLLRDKSTKFYTILPGTNRPSAFPVDKISNFEVIIWKNGMVVLKGSVAGGHKVTRIVGRK